MTRPPLAAGLTFASLSASLLGLLFVAASVQMIGVVDAPSAGPFGSEALPMSAMIPIFAVALLAGAFRWAAHRRLLSPAELLCIFYCLLIAAPLVSTGFWRFFLGVAATVPRYSEFDKYDFISPRMWPHGPNLLNDALGPDFPNRTTQGNVSPSTFTINPNRSEPGLILTNPDPTATSAIRFHLPLFADPNAPPQIVLRDFYLLTFLCRATDLGPNSFYYCRVDYDGQPGSGREIFSSRQPATPTAVQPEGFVRQGFYGLTFPESLQESVQVEIGLSGPGRLQIADVELLDVSAIEEAYRGRDLISRSDYERLPPQLRGRMAVAPDSLFSWDGLRFLAVGYFDAGAWFNPLLFWGGLVGLLLLASFALACIFRRQWIESERYPLPMAQVPLALTGGEERDPDEPPLWRNWALWLGFGLMMVWCLLKGWAGYDPSIPSISPSFSLKAYFTDPMWGKTWDAFYVNLSGLFFALALFMELNVSLSLIVGFLLFRLQFWFGEAQGIGVDRRYPYPGEQMTGSFLMYAAVIVLLARKHLWAFGRALVHGDPPSSEGTGLSSRASFALLLASALGLALWAAWAELPLSRVSLVFLVLVAMALVAAKFRAECGTPVAEFTKVNIGAQMFFVLVPIFGGITFWGPEITMLVGMITTTLIVNCFWVTPGIQMELVALGDRLRVKPWHVAGAACLGVMGGFLIGGWVYFSGANALGADNYPILGHFGIQRDAPNLFNTELAAVNERLKAAEAGTATWFSASNIAFAFGAFGTLICSLLRQMFAGFWFHPMGFIVGPSDMMERAWSSIFAAWLVRGLVLRLGGAATVRHRLIPFAIGCVTAIVAAGAFFAMLQSYLYFFNPGLHKFDGRF